MNETETTVEIGGQRMTQAQFDAARFPLLTVPVESRCRCGHSSGQHFREDPRACKKRCRCVSFGSPLPGQCEHGQTRPHEYAMLGRPPKLHCPGPTAPVESTPDGGAVETPHRWRKKPVEVEAMCLAPEYGPNDFLDPTARALAEIAGWMLGHGFDGFRVAGDRFPHGLDIETLEGTMRADPGDWIIRGVQGEFYPIKDSIFRETYEPVEEF